ncbi:heavy metal translocating P-type ATPase [Thioalkalicoccus limnaeus]|uniref:Heavy metal translocating P-type ATPase n=1 Tax=Thioalkalicoccus limnaeus TaxID=120681 RepID=A0ABV4BH68_9GAMM
MTEGCFHCGEALTGTEPWCVEIDGQRRRVCCPGCQAVAELIRDAGLTGYYQYRRLPAERPFELVAGDRPDQSWQPFDRPDQLDAVSAPIGDGLRACTIFVEGLRCAACSWLIERRLEQVPGVCEIRVNPSSARARLVWDPRTLPLSAALGALAQLGYRPHPGAAGLAEAVQRERRAALRRLGVAGLGMMQVMMYAVALWFGAFQDMEPGLEHLLRWVSLLVATPVALYAAYPFYVGAWRDLRGGRPGMDVPVALAIGGGWLASAWHTLIGAGPVYFESVTMFTFFLLLGRYLEAGARYRAGDTHEALARLLPASARRRSVQGDWETVALRELVPGDRLSVRHGETLPADGRLRGPARLDESMLTGEARARERAAGESAWAGSLNLGDPLELEVQRTGAETMVSAIGRLLDRAQSERPPLAVSADRVARWFVFGVLLAAAATWFVWHQLDPARAFEVTLAVLVATCPCALSIATPAALTAATGFLARQGLLVTRGGAIEALARVDHLLFDKTGTLTHGRPRITDVTACGELDEEQVFGVAAALETLSEHPIARAFTVAAPIETARDVQVVPGLGIEGEVLGRRWRLGRPDWALGLARDTPEPAAGGDETLVYLVDDRGVAGIIRLADQVRAGSRAAVDELKRLGLSIEIASGDRAAAVAPIAAAVGLDRWHGGLAPEDKLALLRARQRAGARVAMVGDGVNDAPVLAGADVSVALAGGTPLAQTSADLVLLGEALSPLATGVVHARRTLRIVRQNLAWAAAYNLTMLPLAAAGLVTPWIAALGMSASSLLVVLNALRLSGAPRPTRNRAPDLVADGAGA